MTCACGSEAVTIQLKTGADGGMRGLVNICQSCGAQWVGEAFVPQAKPSLEPPRPAIVAHRPAAPKQRPLTERSLIVQARRQLRELDREISRLKKLERQRDQLARLLAAANDHGPKVVPMKRAENAR